MSDNIIKTKSFNFAIRIVNLYKYLCDTKKEFVLSKQILKSGTSIGANVTEALNGQSKRDFLMKMNIALKEAAETGYWLDLLKATDFISEKEHKSLFNDCSEIENILASIVKTTANKLEK